MGWLTRSKSLLTATSMFEIGGICEPPADFESILMANALVHAAAQVVGITDRAEAQKLTGYVYRVSRAIIGNELADELNYPPASTFGALPRCRLQSRYGRLIRKVWPKHATHSNFSNFTDLFTASQYDDEGISYDLPDHLYAEESSRY